MGSRRCGSVVFTSAVRWRRRSTRRTGRLRQRGRRIRTAGGTPIVCFVVSCNRHLICRAIRRRGARCSGRPGERKNPPADSTWLDGKFRRRPRRNSEWPDQSGRSHCHCFRSRFYCRDDRSAFSCIRYWDRERAMESVTAGKRERHPDDLRVQRKTVCSDHCGRHQGTPEGAGRRDRCVCIPLMACRFKT